MIALKRTGFISFLFSLVLILIGQSAEAGVEIVVKNTGNRDFQVFSATLQPAGLGRPAMVRVEGWTTVPAKRTRSIRSTGTSSRFAIGFVTEDGFYPFGFSGTEDIATDFPPLVAIKPGEEFSMAYSDGGAAFPAGYVAAGISEPMKVPASGRHRVRLHVDIDPGEEGYPFLPLNSAAVRRQMQLK